MEVARLEGKPLRGTRHSSRATGDVEVTIIYNNTTIDDRKWQIRSLQQDISLGVLQGDDLAIVRNHPVLHRRQQLKPNSCNPTNQRPHGEYADDKVNQVLPPVIKCNKILLSSSQCHSVVVATQLYNGRAGGRRCVTGGGRGVR